MKTETVYLPGSLVARGTEIHGTARPGWREKGMLSPRYLVARVLQVVGGREQSEETARLFAAAPDLLEALEGFLSWSIENEERPNYATKVQKPVIVEKVRAAIAKARGVANI